VVLSTDLVGQPADRAAELLADRGLAVRRAPLTGAAAGALVDVGSLLRRPGVGDEVTLFEDETGAVRHFTVTRATAAGPVLARPADLSHRLATLEAELADVRRQLTSPPRRAPAKATAKTPAKAAAKTAAKATAKTPAKAATKKVAKAAAKAPAKASGSSKAAAGGEASVPRRPTQKRRGRT
jgi:hypothetical protein